MTKNRSFGGYRSAAAREGKEKGEGAREGESHGRSAAAREGKEKGEGAREGESHGRSAAVREGKENAHGRRWEKKKREGEENILLRYKV
ncbi:MAG: hypothetical protein ACOX5T_06235 [Candidatus Cryptobacteroides sp.]